MGVGSNGFRMPVLRIALLTALVAALLPGAALGATPQPLKDVAPLGTQFKDRVTASSPRVAHTSLNGRWDSYSAPDGANVVAAISSRYRGQVTSAVPQSYVDFLDSLDHGPELDQLR